MSKMYQELLDIATQAALTSGQMLLQHKESGINSSFGKDIKLKADIESEKMIFEILKKSHINILSEEAGFIELDKTSDLLWIIDPLDGSLNYSRNIPLNCISIALWKGEIPVLGIIYDYHHNQLFKGIVGQGAFVNDTKIEPSSITEKSEAIITTGFPVYSSFEDKALKEFIKTIQTYKKVRLLGSAALSLSLITNGSVEAYCENNIAWWDVAAGIALVLSAGGKVDFRFTDREKNLLRSCQ
jgi:myo-inositol-1(or 4)-monophosphatase